MSDLFDERYCLACQKPGHCTDECHSTHGLNTPAERELFRLVTASRATGTVVAAPSGEWERAQRICDDPQVDEELRAFLGDPHNDSGVGVVRAVLRAAAADGVDSSGEVKR